MTCKRTFLEQFVPQDSISAHFCVYSNNASWNLIMCDVLLVRLVQEFIGFLEIGVNLLQASTGSEFYTKMSPLN